MTRRPRPSKGPDTSALWVPLRFPTRASWDEHLARSAAERAALAALNVPPHDADSIVGELETPTGEESE